MVTDSQKSKVWIKNNEDRGNTEIKEQKFDISISNHETGFLNFLKIYRIHHSWKLQKLLGLKN